jgi:hypothetical protein
MRAKFATNPPTTGRVTIKGNAKSVAATMKRKQKGADKKKIEYLKLYPIPFTEQDKLIACLAIPFYLTVQSGDKANDPESWNLLKELGILIMRYINEKKPEEDLILEINSLTFFYHALATTFHLIDKPSGKESIAYLYRHEKKKVTPKQIQDMAEMVKSNAQSLMKKIGKRHGKLKEVAALIKEVDAEWIRIFKGYKKWKKENS